jgi:hypothetical protein
MKFFVLFEDDDCYLEVHYKFDTENEAIAWIQKQLDECNSRKIENYTLIRGEELPLYSKVGKVYPYVRVFDHALTPEEVL